MRNELLVIGAVLGVCAIIASTCVHMVDEGHIGLYWRGGALLNSISEPGYNFKLPLITSFEQVQVSVQTDKVMDIPCGTSGGVVIHFEKIEVVNRLKPEFALETVRKYTLNYDKTWIFDKIHHEINQFCSSHTLQEVYIDQFDMLDEMLARKLQTDCNKWAPGMEIIATRVTKPRIPKQIRDNYELMEFEKTNLLISTERQKVVEKEAETERLLAMTNADKLALVSKIRMEEEMAIQKATRDIQTIDDGVVTAHQKALADASFYKSEKVAQGNEIKMSASYQASELYRAIANQPKVFFGTQLNTALQGLELEGVVDPVLVTSPIKN